MRFWITKNSELPIREQLVRQVILGILSEDLPEGERVPSVRALARRHRIHPNTVGAAYLDLLERGWLESRRGSGLYVRSLRSTLGDGGLDQLIHTFLEAAKHQGHEPGDVLRRLEQLVRPRVFERVLVVEQDPGMRGILQAEIADRVAVPVDTAELNQMSKADLRSTLVAFLTTRADAFHRSLPTDATCIPLRLRSIPESLQGQTKPDPGALVSIVSQSAEIRYGARVMLIAVGIAPESLCDVDPEIEDWPQRLAASALVITDVVTAPRLPAGCPARVFHVIADSSLDELKQLCPPPL